jgi:N-acetyl sugar amidotransferase
MLPIYDQKKLEQSLEANCGRPYQQCAISVMDTIADPNITFDEKGISNYYYGYLEAQKAHVFSGDIGRQKLNACFDAIKKDGKGKQYDCIIGLSGGVDSSYLALLAKQEGLRVLLVHFDYGWNSELAVMNIEHIVKHTGFDLYTYVMDWNEFKGLQRSYFKASVLDLDIPADHMIFGALYKVVAQYNIKFLISGHNVCTENTLPKTWNYSKFDLTNLQNIHAKFGDTSLSKLPKLGLLQRIFFDQFKNIQMVSPLNFVPYNKAEVKQTIIKELGWRDYGGKHHESVFTRFYQGYILPCKFNIDKRKAHLSDLIFSGQITKEAALAELAQPTYDPQLQATDFTYVAKKLGFTEAEFDAVLRLPNVAHETYGTDRKQTLFYFNMLRTFKPVTRIIKKVLGRP